MGTGYLFVQDVIIENGSVMLSGADHRNQYMNNVPYSPRFSPATIPNAGDVVTVDFMSSGGPTATGVLLTPHDIQAYSMGAGDVLIKGKRIIIAGEVEYIS